MTGLDFSANAIEAAGALASSVGIEAAFVCGSLDAASPLLNTRFDVVYTGKGALCWLPDLDRWAGVVSELIAPGGSLYLAEFHPFVEVFSYRELAVESSYFRRGEEIVDEDRRGSYADLTAPTAHNRTVQWSHTMGDIVSAISDHGLRIRFLHEFPYTLFPRWPWLEAGPDGVYRLPAEVPPLPLLFSIRADRGDR